MLAQHYIGQNVIRNGWQIAESKTGLLCPEQPVAEIKYITTDFLSNNTNNLTETANRYDFFSKKEIKAKELTNNQNKNTEIQKRVKLLPNIFYLSEKMGSAPKMLVELARNNGYTNKTT